MAPLPEQRRRARKPSPEEMAAEGQQFMEFMAKMNEAGV